ncbi:MAG: GNAT family N-acetyltransferase [Candidatus Thorarchaeota archaeon]
MKLRRMTQEELSDTYPILFQKIFGYYDSDQLIDFAVICEEDDGSIVGFASFRFFKKTTVHLHYTGIMPEYQRKAYWSVMENICKWLTEQGITRVTGKVDQMNIPALMGALKLGWYVYGTERGSDKDLLINIAKKLGE